MAARCIVCTLNGSCILGCPKPRDPGLWWRFDIFKFGAADTAASADTGEIIRRSTRCDHGYRHVRANGELGNGTTIDTATPVGNNTAGK